MHYVLYVCFSTELSRAYNLPRSPEESSMDMQLLKEQVRDRLAVQGLLGCFVGHLSTGSHLLTLCAFFTVSVAVTLY